MSARPLDSTQPQSIEVAAMLGNSVVGIKHCLDPRTGQLSRTTWALIAGGAAALVASAIAFVVSVSTAAANARALDVWTRVQHKPAHAFRPVMLGAGWDVIAFGGLVAGLAALAVALFRMRDERRSPSYRVGTAPGVELPLAEAPTASFPLVAPAGDRFAFCFGPGIEGELMEGGSATALAELAASGRATPSHAIPGAFALAIPPHARIRARIGKATVIVASVERPRRQAGAMLSGDHRFLGFVAASLLAHLALWALVTAMPEDGGAANVEIDAYEETSIASTANEHENPVPPEQEGDGGDSDNPGAAATHAVMPLPEGAAGTQTGQVNDTRMQVAHRDSTDAHLAREQALEAARLSGVLGDEQLADVVASVASDQNTSNGFDTQNVRGSLFGADGSVEGYGFGVGRTGIGPGGGNGDGLIAAGAYGTICGNDAHDCGGTYGGSITGSGTYLGHKHVDVTPGVHVGQVESIGSLDKSIIRRYIQRNLAKIGFCYEHELLARHDLEGTISVKFFIQPDGSVGSAAGSGFDATVASCVASVVKSIEFPRPGAGGVEVNYPFTFHAAGH